MNTTSGSVKSNNPWQSVIQTLPPGYKQTDVGVIPEDWATASLVSIGTFSKGQGIRKDEAESGDLPAVRYGELYTHHNDVIRSFNSWITRDVARSSRRLRRGDLLFAGSGETKEEIGKCSAFVGDEEVYAGGDIIILSPDRNNATFLGYLLNAPIVARQKASKGQGDAIVHISASALSSITIPLPPTLAEQQAIAEALSDVDALISALDRLIAKKRAIKQGAMQELLTGRRRLPGFDGEWEVSTFGEVFNISAGGDVDPNATILFQDQTHRYPVYSNALTGCGLYGFCSHADHQAGSITVTARGTLGFANFRDHAFTAIGRVLILYPFVTG